MFDFTKLRTFEGVKQGKLHGLKRKFIFKALMSNKVVVDPFPDLHFIKRERESGRNTTIMHHHQLD